MDINNKMILMRKDIKKAKAQVIARLVRHMQSLRSKKGSEQQLLKNSSRAERLFEEIQILKVTKPDDIFKFLLTSDACIQDVSRADIALRDRVFIRVGLVPFIKTRLFSIREQVSDFNKTRSKNEVISSIEVMKKIAKMEYHPGKNKDSTTDDSVKKSNMNNNKREEDEENDLEEQSEFDNLSDSPIPSSNELASSVPVLCCNDDEQPAGTFCDSNMDILQDNPCTDSNEDHTNINPLETCKSNVESFNNATKRKFDFLSTNATDVSEILENIGQGFFDSDEEALDRGDPDKSTGKDSEEDLFFCDQTVSRTHCVSKRRKASLNYDGDELSSVKSAFVDSLTPSKSDVVKPALTKGRKKNRLGQRERKLLYGNHTQNQVDAGSKQRSTSSFRNETKKTKDNEACDLHPSWQASRLKKTQNVIHAFKGTHVRFDDSD
ncbi:unnamed protein product [Clavelina lepadiformis]|uniref:Serum response factor-binding protein 1 n=1 Tax=Clavelina lepadiformis TaxID=159417 RepID=A0ABP0EZ89_CLALP